MFFKQVNNDHGHGALDKVFVSHAKPLLERLRASNYPRCGSEEFLILLQNTDLSDVSILAARYHPFRTNKREPFEWLKFILEATDYRHSENVGSILSQLQNGHTADKGGGQNRLVVS